MPKGKLYSQTSPDAESIAKSTVFPAKRPMAHSAPRPAQPGSEIQNPPTPALPGSKLRVVASSLPDSDSTNISFEESNNSFSSDRTHSFLTDSDSDVAHSMIADEEKKEGSTPSINDEEDFLDESSIRDPKKNSSDEYIPHNILDSFSDEDEIDSDAVVTADEKEEQEKNHEPRDEKMISILHEQYGNAPNIVYLDSMLTTHWQDGSQVLRDKLKAYHAERQQKHKKGEWIKNNVMIPINVGDHLAIVHAIYKQNSNELPRLYYSDLIGEKLSPQIKATLLSQGLFQGCEITDLNESSDIMSLEEAWGINKSVSQVSDNQFFKSSLWDMPNIPKKEFNEDLKDILTTYRKYFTCKDELPPARRLFDLFDLKEHLKKTELLTSYENILFNVRYMQTEKEIVGTFSILPSDQPCLKKELLKWLDQHKPKPTPIPVPNDLTNIPFSDQEYLNHILTNYDAYIRDRRCLKSFKDYNILPRAELAILLANPLVTDKELIKTVERIITEMQKEKKIEGIFSKPPLSLRKELKAWVSHVKQIAQLKSNWDQVQVKIDAHEKTIGTKLQEIAECKAAQEKRFAELTEKYDKQGATLKFFKQSAMNIQPNFSLDSYKRPTAGREKKQIKTYLDDKHTISDLQAQQKKANNDNGMAFDKYQHQLNEIKQELKQRIKDSLAEAETPQPIHMSNEYAKQITSYKELVASQRRTVIVLNSIVNILNNTKKVVLAWNMQLDTLESIIQQRDTVIEKVKAELKPYEDAIKAKEEEAKKEQLAIAEQLKETESMRQEHLKELKKCFAEYNTLIKTSIEQNKGVTHFSSLLQQQSHTQDDLLKNIKAEVAATLKLKQRLEQRLRKKSKAKIPNVPNLEPTIAENIKTIKELLSSTAIDFSEFHTEQQQAEANLLMQEETYKKQCPEIDSASFSSLSSYQMSQRNEALRVFQREQCILLSKVQEFSKKYNASLTTLLTCQKELTQEMKNLQSKLLSQLNAINDSQAKLTTAQNIMQKEQAAWAAAQMKKLQQEFVGIQQSREKMLEKKKH
jgi:hypothetical protein